MKLSQAVRIAQMKLRRWDSTRYYGINLQTRTWCWINAAKNEYHGDFLPDPLLTEAVVMKLHRDTKKYEVIEWYGTKVLINRYNVVKDVCRTRNIFSKYRNKPTIVLKCDSKKKKARAKSAARRAYWEKHFRVREDVYGFDSISNVSFGHPKRMKTFSLKEKTNERNKRAYKERNIPPLP